MRRFITPFILLPQLALALFPVLVGCSRSDDPRIYGRWVMDPSDARFHCPSAKGSLEFHSGGTVTVFRSPGDRWWSSGDRIMVQSPWLVQVDTVLGGNPDPKAPTVLQLEPDGKISWHLGKGYEVIFKRQDER